MRLIFRKFKSFYVIWNTSRSFHTESNTKFNANKMNTNSESSLYSAEQSIINEIIERVVKEDGEDEVSGGGGGSGEGMKKAKISTQYLTSPSKSQNDKKDYRVIRLPNGLTALLISDVSQDVPYVEQENDDTASTEDESTGSSSSESEIENEMYNSDDETDRPRKASGKEEKLAALGLCIGVGSFSDPWDIQGMAHFLEHMVFMGSEKYPKENDFDAFIKKRGGTDNASTECEYTTFYFECQEKHLKEATDKFSQFFISPLMKREAMTREREAIESEFQMVITSDENRKEQLLCCTAHPEHPIRKFTWGNLKTLRDNIADDALYEAVHDFRKRHYSAHRMTVAVQATIPLDNLESMIVTCFSDVPNNDLPADDFTKFGTSVFSIPKFRKIYWVKPVKDICEVELTWALPSMIHMYRSKPDEYVATLIGHEGKGSLLAYLRKKVWALDITAGNDDDGLSNNTMYTLFKITIVLTDDGFAHLQEVLNAVFGYIKMLQKVGPSEQFFKELQTIGDTNFQFAEEVSADEYVENLAENMHIYPPEEYITGSELFFEFNPEGIQKCMDALTPDSVNIMVFYKDCGKEFEKVEYWFKTEYSCEDIPNDWLESWSIIEPDESFSMPEPNIYLTTDFSLLPFPETEESNKYPVKVQDDELSEVWYRRDSKFKLPHAFLYFYLISPLSVTSPQNAAMMDLYVAMLKQVLVEEIYPADVADLSFAMYPSDKGIVLKLNGFNQKLPLLLDTVLNRMASFESCVTENLFDALKEVQSRYYYNNCIKPDKLCRDLRFSLLLHVYWNAVDKHAATSKITVSTMKTFAKHFMERLYIQCLIQGNISEQEAIGACKKVVDILKCMPLLPNTLPQLRVSQIPLGEHCCRVKSFISNDANSNVTNYYQSGPVGIKSSCIVDLLMLLMEEPVFDVLRTKEQLGYHVYSTMRDTFGILGFSITVNCQADKHSVEHVDKRIEAFLKKFAKVLKKLKERELEEVRNSLIKLKQLSDIHLKEEVTRNWGEITTGDYMFNRQEREVACLEVIKLAEIRKWYHDHMAGGSKINYRKMTIQVAGSADSNKMEEDTNEIEKQEHELPPQVNRLRKQSKTLPPLLCNDFPKASFFYGSQVEMPLQFFSEEKDGVPSNYYITDIEEFKNGLFIYPVNKLI